MARVIELQSQRRVFWRGIHDGLRTVDAARAAEVSADRGFRWFRECGGVAPVTLRESSNRFLSLAEREEIACGLAAGESDACRACQLFCVGPVVDLHWR